MTLSRQELAHYIDHTILKPEATRAQVEELVHEASELGTFSVCVSPSQLPLETPEHVKVATVVGFPSGNHHPEVKAFEAKLAVSHGADEVDMVINISDAVENHFEKVEHDIRTVREAIPDALLKVIIESAALSDEQIVACCEAAEKAGADYVKTSTGFHPSGGASTHAVSLMAKTVGDRLGVKASGGIRDTETALAMIDAGATRLGCSASKAIVEGLE
ncbi:deoxyribose-phosphate aldolase [Corynebacterium sp. ES2794-CONJ1]|uniref:deoxyribose-phosphate aldolase n=1 Tax=unclassified Corynebacterium TaxID=2624378 RepID=UPI002167CAB5|nr:MULTISPECIES: deoxyribose-phosphate aldolase [unclassified Corynebacterium]MCS4490255.1 deoxyribose-phosphate aldolase [Corynebacterium sp. ES2775-CONJ]MCS4491934.1 deoxyribose-phosphate aldolase [Corynebacterium sp. ES2715-CONJ3]MCS4532039.1 deoxyribose-phosphate aldolase [Corynebacterium sp. ES2730-CONJ]MCU9519440.1 deoxyribose-phosphate aldolase [Corynebacterium sp. ES2794-CONJ1]